MGEEARVKLLLAKGNSPKATVPLGIASFNHAIGPSTLNSDKYTYLTNKIERITDGFSQGRTQHKHTQTNK